MLNNHHQDSERRMDDALISIEEKLRELKALEAELRKKNQDILAQTFTVRHRVSLLESIVKEKR